MNFHSPAPADEGNVDILEQSLIGALLLGQGLARIRGFLLPSHFIRAAHGDIYEAICAAYDRHGSTAMPLVLKLIPEGVAEAVRQQTGDTIAHYLAHAMAETHHTGALLEKAARAVIAQWALSRMAFDLDQASLAARDPSADPVKVGRLVGSAIEETLADVRGSGTRKSRQTIAQAADCTLAAARDAMAKGGEITGLSWGYADVNRLTGGMQRKDLILIGARPSMGKTSLMVSSALACARKGAGTAILSLEMDSEKLTARALSDLTFGSHMPIPYNDIIHGHLDQERFEHLEAKRDRLRELPIAIDDGTVTTFEIRAKIETMMEQFERAGWPRLECVMVDHLGWVKPSEHYRGNRNNEVGEITRALKEYAKEYDIAIVLLSQLSRQVEGRDDKRPTLSDLRDSGNIEQDADTAIFLYREAYYLDRQREKGPKEEERVERLMEVQNKLEFIIAKQRNGPIQTVDLFCDMAFSAVRNGERRPA